MPEMPYQYTPYVLPLLASAAITAGLAVCAWRRRPVPVAAPFALVMLLTTAWCLMYVLEMAGRDLPTKLFWANAQYLCYAFLPVAMLALALAYAGRLPWLSRRRLVLLSLVPLVTVALVWTNEWHGLLRQNVFLDTTGPVSAVGKTYGPWFWVHSAYSYLLLWVALFLLYNALLRTPLTYRGQVLVLLVGSLLPMAWNVVYLLGFSPLRGVDVTPISFSLMGVVFAWGLFRLRLLDLVPIAQDKVIEGIRDGVIVIDALGRVIDLNPAAQSFLGYPAAKVLGQKAAEVFGNWPALIELCGKAAPLQAELTLGEGPPQRYYEAYISPLLSQDNCLIGEILVLHEITQRKQVEDALRESESKYRELADSLPETVFEADVTGHLTFANRSGLEHFGYTKEDFQKGIYIPDALAPEDRERAMLNFAKVLRGEWFAPNEYTALRKDGTTFPIIIVPSRILRGGVPVGLRGFLVDITERRQIQAKLLQQQRALAVLEERDRVARELHDSLGQVLGYVNTQAQAVRELLAQSQIDKADAYLARLVTVAQDAQADVREYILGVRELAPSQRGFLVALEHYLRRFGENNELRTELVPCQDLADNALDPAAEVQLLRVVQEALTNIRKHACARSAKILLENEGDQLRIVIEDDGKGFDPSEPATPLRQSFGLRIMRERAQEVGGNLSVCSSPGQGTRIIVQVPLSKERTSEIDTSYVS